MRYFIIAGEASGDNYANRLIQGLKEVDEKADVHYCGPDAKTAVMGFVEILASLRAILKRLAWCKKELLKVAPDVLILIDYPGFNMKMAHFAHRHHIKVFYFIAPKVWASREYRVKKIRQWVDKLYVIFPFELDYFSQKGIKTSFLGNPIVDILEPSLSNPLSETAFREKFLLNDKPILAILPGSRRKEIEFLLPLAAQIVEQFKDYQWVVCATHANPPAFYEAMLQDLPVRVMYGSTYEVLMQAKAAIVSSGTATLEAALLNCPQVVCYGGSPLSVAIARRIIKVHYISLPNLILDKPAVCELIQKDCTPAHIADELGHLLPGKQKRRSVLASYKRLQKMIQSQEVSLQVAQDMVRTLDEKKDTPSFTAYTPTPFGLFSFSSNQQGEITGCRFEDNPHPIGFFCQEKPLNPEDIPPVLHQAISQLEAYFAGTLRVFDLPLKMEGTEFQKKVWSHLCSIPYGTTLSYIELAELCGNAKAARAVGQANNANPFPILIPCHRVIGHDGGLVGYAAGISRKQKLLAMEKSYAPERSNALF